jgi:STE24 endopeptidase
LPWLWWSYLSVQFIGIPSDTLYGIALGLWLLSGLVVLYPRIEEHFAARFHHLRPASVMDLQILGPAWWQVCAVAGIDPNKFRLWIYEGPETTAPITAGNTVAVSHWSLYNLGSRRGRSPHLEAVLAHELAHHLAVPRFVSLAIFWLSLPARITGAAIMAGLKNPVLSIVVKLVLGLLVLGVLLVWFFTGLSFYIVMMLSPLVAPIVVPWAARAEEMYADRVATDLGYGVLLVQIFSGREAQRGIAGERVSRRGLGSQQPMESARLRALEKRLTRLSHGGAGCGMSGSV